MTATPLDGRALAAKVRAAVKEEVAEHGGLKLATVLVGDDPASHLYIGLKHKAAEEVGIEPLDLRLPADIAEEELLDVLRELNDDDEVDGILPQLP
ncbi:MAG TPA: tetrahydrofolate dehydrogenase/cyclohydrolase catalytic domain-containing protein, partial [Gaiellaceae bacterium]|nr:tetrahydrofolate dehydrogenase/cyclohydrolase catalytic domain-containing protein [Gaiellaceae bacterium]